MLKKEILTIISLSIYIFSFLSEPLLNCSSYLLSPSTGWKKHFFIKEGKDSQILTFFSIFLSSFSQNTFSSLFIFYFFQKRDNWLLSSLPFLGFVFFLKIMINHKSFLSIFYSSIRDWGKWIKCDFKSFHHFHHPTTTISFYLLLFFLENDKLISISFFSI